MLKEYGTLFWEPQLYVFTYKLQLNLPEPRTVMLNTLGKTWQKEMKAWHLKLKIRVWSLFHSVYEEY